MHKIHLTASVFIYRPCLRADSVSFYNLVYWYKALACVCACVDVFQMQKYYKLGSMQRSLCSVQSLNQYNHIDYFWIWRNEIYRGIWLAVTELEVGFTMRRFVWNAVLPVTLPFQCLHEQAIHCLIDINDHYWGFVVNVFIEKEENTVSLSVSYVAVHPFTDLLSPRFQITVWMILKNS